ncbi:MAG: hypothetical protein ACLFQV_11775 [Vulcanimicrobiota bacterium]
MPSISPLGNTFKNITPVQNRNMFNTGIASSLPSDSFIFSGSSPALDALPSSISHAITAKSNAAAQRAGARVSSPVFSPTNTAPAEKTETASNVPTFLSMMDGLQDKLNFWMPWDEAQSLGLQLDRFGDSREAALREFDTISTERNFALEAMQQKLEEIARRKDEVQQKLEQKRAAEEVRQREAESLQGRMDKLNQNGNLGELDSRIQDLNYKISNRSSSVSSRKEKIAQLKEEMENNPEKKDEIQAQIDELKGELADEKRELQQQKEEKQRLEVEKQAKEQKQEENKIKKEELKNRKEQLEQELAKLQNEESNILNMVNAKDDQLEQVKGKIDENRTKLEKLQWLFNEFEYNTRGM